MLDVHAPRAPRHGARPLTAALLLAAALHALPAHGTNDADLAGWIQICADEWDDAPASGSCSGATVSRITTEGDQNGYCTVSGTCSITVNVDSESTTFTPSVDLTVSPDHTDTIDICFKQRESPDAAIADTFLGGGDDVILGPAWSATVKAGCATDETTSATASASGLAS